MNHPSSNAKPGILRRIFSGLWSALNWIRIILTNLIFLLILLVILFSLSSKTSFTLPDEFALRLAPTGMLVDQRSYIDPVSLLMSSNNPESAETVVRDLVDAIHFAAEDKRINTLVMELDSLIGGGISKLQEVGQALEHFKASGKTIIAFGNNFTQDQYYLASYADQIYLNDMGAVLLTGYGSYRNYFKGALDKLQINFHVFRTGKYKDAVEPLLRDSMSEESKEHNAQWLNELWHEYTTQVERGRNLPPGAINDYVNNMDLKLRDVDGNSAQLALHSGLVNGILNYNEIQESLKARVGKSPHGNFYNGVDYDQYLHLIRSTQLPSANQIGVLVASGTVLDGEQPDGVIGSHTLAALLQQVREEPAIKALVIRVDSGGGSAFASEVIRAEIEATRAAGIPVFISMGSLAASGGYWIAAGGDQIWATPTTLTGSIGVFGAFPTFENTLASLGLTTDGVGTTELAGAMRSDRELSPKAGRVLQLNVDYIYRRFLETVAEARSADVDAIGEIAEGRVWSGLRAKELGLVDNLGTLNDVIAAAADHTGLTDYQVRIISRPLSPGEMFLRQLMETNAGALAPKALINHFAGLKVQQHFVPLLKPLNALSQMNDPQTVYASCLDCIVP